MNNNNSTDTHAFSHSSSLSLSAQTDMTYHCTHIHSQIHTYICGPKHIVSDYIYDSLYFICIFRSKFDMNNPRQAPGYEGEHFLQSCCAAPHHRHWSCAAPSQRCEHLLLCAAHWRHFSLYITCSCEHKQATLIRHRKLSQSSTIQFLVIYTLSTIHLLVSYTLSTTTQSNSVTGDTSHLLVSYTLSTTTQSNSSTGELHLVNNPVQFIYWWVTPCQQPSPIQLLVTYTLSTTQSNSVPGDFHLVRRYSDLRVMSNHKLGL